MGSRFNWQAVGIALAVMLVVSGPVLADTVEQELERIIGNVESMVTQLAVNEHLDKAQTDTLRSDLAQVYRDLVALKIRLAGDSINGNGGQQQQTAQPLPRPQPQKPPQPDSSQWQPYSNASSAIDPPSAVFDGWKRNADIDFGWGNYGEVILEVSNDAYTAVWTIRDAYTGSVNVGTQSTPDGDITMTVEDDLGSHEFLLQSGGLGPLYHRELDAKRPPKSVSPAANTASGSGNDTDASSEWYGAYRDLVNAGQLDTNQAMEWFIDQYGRMYYLDNELMELGQTLRRLDGPDRASIGQLSYASGGQSKVLDIPDPRANPAGFIHVISKVYNMYNDGQGYSIAMDE